MSRTCVIGLQWGDEAKGKIVDLLTPRFDIVVRYQGGANAGHTVVTGGRTYKLHQIPSGILNPGVMNIVSGGVVLNPATAIGELDNLTSAGIDVTKNLMLSDRAHVVFPWHIVEDRAMDQQPSDEENIGTTMRGIGPCYRDKVTRSTAIRLGDLYRTDFRDKVRKICQNKQQFLTASGQMADAELLDPDKIFSEYSQYALRLQPYVGDTTAYLLDAVEANKNVLFEGAQGALLDVDHGTYPFVTSSNSSGVGVSNGSGVPGCWINHVVGIIKAYCTRVGGGPFPTEQDNETGQHIRDLGNEYGTTTGRPRRCGWFDAVAARYTTRLSGVSVLSVMMLDVLSQLEEIQVCVAYEINGKKTRDFPSHVDDLRRVKPVYETMPGWRQDVTAVERYEDLPENARKYVEYLGTLLDRPVGIVSVGPDRRQTFFNNFSID